MPIIVPRPIHIIPFNVLPPILAHRDEPEELAEKHWTFGDKMKPTMTAPSRGSDLRCFTSPRHDQRQTHSCAGQTVIKYRELLRIKTYGAQAHVDLSRLACYFLARELMDPPETDKDDGSYISANVEALRRFGTCVETLWQFDERLVLKSPPWRVMQSAYKNKIPGWARISSSDNDRVDDTILTLANGLPVAYGRSVGQDWYDYNSNSAPLGITENPKGRHATLLLGWDPQKQVFIGENSWGTSWGIDGFYEVRPEAIASDDARDFIVMADTPARFVNV